MRFSHVAVVAALAWGSCLTGVGRAADQLNLVLGTNSSSSGILIPVADLRTFAQTGNAPGNLQSILGLLSPEMQNNFRQALKVNYPVDVADLEQRAISDNGNQILTELAAATLRPGPDGVNALKTAILKTAANPQGFNLVDFIQAYPEPILNLDINQMQALIKTNDKLVALAVKKFQQVSPNQAPTSP
ncbi:alpha/beta hydrolase [Thermosynechococcaceae cyanobacterium BACA0444]|uniref:Alpha/beta hydrolase n=1 Tax=Pseudocalidococcus azoricus BACA0444 TaxID=2918990 RepID=A0AAE4JZ92_9CYAN|nr:alpha/beta hydrolase [Pseudocalidococcus azoricus]MDS3861839.1 alpha/beta hydrolase [Pseudocalidococcus azoricus BACA0444]